MSPTQVQQSKNSLLEREILRTKEVQEASDKARKELAHAQLSFKETLSGNLQRWAEEEETHQKAMAARLKEIETLEDRKNQALIPLSIYQERVDKQAKEVQAMYRYCQDWEERLQKTEDVLEERLDETAEKKKELDDFSLVMQRQAKGIEIQAQQTSFNANRLSEQMYKFNNECQVRELQVGVREQGVLMRERSLDSRELSLQARQEELKGEKIRIDDQRATLERAMKRLKK